MEQKNKLKLNSGGLLVFILTVGVFGIINTEMGVVGILPLIAETFKVSVPQAGWTVSVFALVVAASAPITPLLFSGVNRKKVMLLALKKPPCAQCHRLQICCNIPPSSAVNMHKIIRSPNCRLYKNENRAVLFEVSCRFLQKTDIF